MGKFSCITPTGKLAHIAGPKADIRSGVGRPPANLKLVNFMMNSHMFGTRLNYCCCCYENLMYTSIIVKVENLQLDMILD